MSKIYRIYNSTATSTAAPVKQPTGTAIRTMLQIQLGVGQMGRVVEWGCSFDGSAAATPGQVELFACSGAATMSTAATNADIMPLNDAYAFVNASNVPFALSTTTTGFATAGVTEGTVANYRSFDAQLIAPTNQYVKQFPLGREPEFAHVLRDGTTPAFVRVRMTFGTTVNAYIYVDVEV
jgi:hypothetical protein